MAKTNRQKLGTKQLDDATTWIKGTFPGLVKAKRAVDSTIASGLKAGASGLRSIGAGGVVDSAKAVLNTIDQGQQWVSDKTGIDRRITDFATDVALTAATGGVGKVGTTAANVSKSTFKTYATSALNVARGKGPAYFPPPPSFRQLVGLPTGPKNIGAAGTKVKKIGDRQGHNVFKYLQKGGNASLLKNRDFNAAKATNYDLSDQIAYQQRYASSRLVGSQSHHIGNHQIWGQAMSRADSPDIDRILVKNKVVKGNDALNMIDAPGWESKKSGIFGKDHGHIHDLYEELPTYKEVKQYLETGSWDRLSPKQAASRLIALAREQDDVVIRWANWKIEQIYKNHPELKTLPPKQLRKWAENNPKEFARMGSMAQMPSYKSLMKAPKRHNNEMLRTLFGLQRGNKSGDLKIKPSTKG